MIMFLSINIIAAFAMASQTRQQEVSSSAASSSVPLLQCWDNIFSPKELSNILSGIDARKHSFTSIIDRQRQNTEPTIASPRSTIESAILSILDQLDDNSRYLEYWARNPSPRPRSLDAHRDIDEGYCKKYATPIHLGSDNKIGKQRCPKNGHVLYVGVECEIGSPTLIWDEAGGAQPGPPQKIKSVWSVPSVSNRLLRFNGNCLHAVAYPPLSFLEGYDDTNNEDIVGKRAVILFNTWDEPPMYPKGDEDLFIGEAELYKRTKGESSCRDISLWLPTATSMLTGSTTESITTDDDSDESSSLLSVPLLGGYSRRGCEEDSVDMLVNCSKAKQTLTSQYDIYAVENLKC